VAEGSTNSTAKSSTHSSLATEGGVILDVGTGDGCYVYRSARADPDRLYIGIDVHTGALEKVSEKVHRKPQKGGLPNVLFVHAVVEDLPSELDGIADEIHIHFPWGSLLRSVVVGDAEVLGGLRRVAAVGAWLEIVIGVDEYRDAGETSRLGLPSLTEEYVRSTLIPRYAAAGFAVEDSGFVEPDDWPHIDTTWAKRLHDNASRSLLFVIARAVT
jgi:16S rRNA (adenine(1408)-N(1))-methyltransferase